MNPTPTVLVVDDEKPLRDFVRRNLDVRGFHTLTAANGLEALATFETQHIDLVIMDVMMPHLDGLETTRRIRQNPKFQKLPILALTAKAMKGDREQCLAAGANDYLSKPVDPDRLFTMLRVWLYD